MQALHEFLKGILAQAGEKMPTQLSQTIPEEELDGEPRPYNEASANAARAYQNTARHTPGQRIDFSERPAGTAASAAQTGPLITLSPEELRIIHKLIEDIEALGQRGIGVIPLIPAGSFLQSLVLGVATASG